MRRLLVLICLSALLLAGCAAADSRMEKNASFSYVEENRELILFCMERNDFSLLGGKFAADDILVRDDHVDFDCGAAGFGSETACRGFFYSEAENLHAVWCAPPPEQFLRQPVYTREAFAPSHFFSFIFLLKNPFSFVGHLPVLKRGVIPSEAEGSSQSFSAVQKVNA